MCSRAQQCIFYVHATSPKSDSNSNLSWYQYSLVYTFVSQENHCHIVAGIQDNLNLTLTVLSTSEQLVVKLNGGRRTAEIWATSSAKSVSFLSTTLLQALERVKIDTNLF